MKYSELPEFRSRIVKLNSSDRIKSVIGIRLTIAILITIVAWFLWKPTTDWLREDTLIGGDWPEDVPPLVHGIRESIHVQMDSGRTFVFFMVRRFGSADVSYKMDWAKGSERNDVATIQLGQEKIQIRFNSSGYLIADKNGEITPLSIFKGIDVESEEVRPIPIFSELHELVKNNPKELEAKRTTILKFLDHEREREKKHPGFFAHAISVLLVDLAKIHLLEKDNKNASRLIGEAITADRKAYATSPDVQIKAFRLARTLQHTALIQKAGESLENELNPVLLSQEAIDILAQLAEQEPAYHGTRINYLTDMANLLLRSRKTIAAAKLLFETSKEINLHPEWIDTNGLKAHFKTFEKLGSDLRKSSHESATKMLNQIYEQRFSLLSKLTSNPDADQTEILSENIRLLVDELTQLGDLDRAIKSLKQEANLFSKLMATNPSVAHQGLMETYEYQQRFFRQNHRDVEEMVALKSWINAALDAIGTVSAVKTNSALIRATRRLRKVQMENGNTDMAIDILPKAIGFIEVGYKANPEKYGDSLFLLLEDLSTSYHLDDEEQSRYALRTAQVWENFLPSRVEPLSYLLIDRVLQLAETLSEASKYTVVASVVEPTLNKVLSEIDTSKKTTCLPLRSRRNRRTRKIELLSQRTLLQLTETLTKTQVALDQLQHPPETFRRILTTIERWENERSCSRELRISILMQLANFYLKRKPNLADANFRLAEILSLEAAYQEPETNNSVKWTKTLSIAEQWSELRKTHIKLGDPAEPFQIIFDRTSKWTKRESIAMSLQLKSLRQAALLNAETKPDKADAQFKLRLSLVLKRLQREPEPDTQSNQRLRTRSFARLRRQTLSIATQWSELRKTRIKLGDPAEPYQFILDRTSKWTTKEMIAMDLKIDSLRKFAQLYTETKPDVADALFKRRLSLALKQLQYKLDVEDTIRSQLSNLIYVSKDWISYRVKNPSLGSIDEPYHFLLQAFSKAGDNILGSPAERASSIEIISDSINSRTEFKKIASAYRLARKTHAAELNRYVLESVKPYVARLQNHASKLRRIGKDDDGLQEEIIKIIEDLNNQTLKDTDVLSFSAEILEESASYFRLVNKPSEAAQAKKQSMKMWRDAYEKTVSEFTRTGLVSHITPEIVLNYSASLRSSAKNKINEKDKKELLNDALNSLLWLNKTHFTQRINPWLNKTYSTRRYDAFFSTIDEYGSFLSSIGLNDQALAITEQAFGLVKTMESPPKDITFERLLMRFYVLNRHKEQHKLAAESTKQLLNLLLINDNDFLMKQLSRRKTFLKRDINGNSQRETEHLPSEIERLKYGLNQRLMQFISTRKDLLEILNSSSELRK